MSKLLTGDVIIISGTRHQLKSPITYCTDCLFRDWLLMLCQVTDCAGRGKPVQYPVTVNRAHRTRALFVGTKPTPQFCRWTNRWPGWVMHQPVRTSRLEPGSSGSESSTLTIRPVRLCKCCAKDITI